jgi:polysaccharide deacetylase family protein (PEP-CTERM system associated)
MKRPEILFSVDVEDWYQVENLKSSVPRRSWDEREPRVEGNTERMLELLQANGAVATFFVLGDIARKHPEVVKRIHAAGHEVASHGHGHELLYQMSPARIESDVLSTKKMLEDLTGAEVTGYRAPAFSITDRAVDILARCGYRYDSSMFAFSLHDRYGKLQNPPVAHSDGLMRHENGLFEVPLSMLSFMGRRLPWAGGGYFRLLPYRLFRAGALRVLSADGAFAFYVHPWEVDPDQPRVKGLKASHRFRHYVNLAKTYQKLRRLAGDFTLRPYRDIIPS